MSATRIVSLRYDNDSIVVVERTDEGDEIVGKPFAPTQGYQAMALAREHAEKIGATLNTRIEGFIVPRSRTMTVRGLHRLMTERVSVESHVLIPRAQRS